MILSKKSSQRNQQAEPKVEPTPSIMKISKKPSEEEEFLLAGITTAPASAIQAPQVQVLSEH